MLDSSPQHELQSAPTRSPPTLDLKIVGEQAAEARTDEQYYDQPAFTIDQPLQVPDYGTSRNSIYDTSPSQSRSRRHSNVFPLFHSSLPYALVRDFAYPPFNPLHYGPLDYYSTSGLSSPTAEYDSSRRLSDPQENHEPGVGPWGDSSYDQSAQAQQLPSTSFGNLVPDQESEDDPVRPQRRFSKHRKSKSYATMDDVTRGRQRTSGDGFKRRSRTAISTDPDSWKRGSSLSREVILDYSHDSLPDRTTYAASEQYSLDSLQHPPFREDTDAVPYSPHDEEEHRPESASLDESFAGPSLALYDFSPEHDNELALREGQIIQVGYRHGLGWLVAMDPETGEQGLVPEEYVRLLRDIEGWGEEGEPDEGGHVVGGLVNQADELTLEERDDDVTLQQHSTEVSTQEPERGKEEEVETRDDATIAKLETGPAAS